MAKPPTLTVDQLRSEIEAGDIDTVVVAFTDMQGRLQGKRLHGHYFLDHVLEHGTEGCNYLLAVDVDMNTVDGYAMSSWERGYGDMFFDLDLGTLRRTPGSRHSATVQCDLDLARRQRPGRAVAAVGAQDAGRPRCRARAGRALRHRARVHRLRGRPTSRRGTRGYTRPHARQPLQRRLLHPRAATGSSRCCATSATTCTPPGSTSRAPRASATSASTRSASSTTTR